MPEWIIDLAKRLIALPYGRHQIILTIGPSEIDWTVITLGKVEKAKR